MKSFKLLLCAVSLMAVVQSSAARADLGVQPKDETRAGTLLCMERATKDGRNLSSSDHSAKEDSREDTSNASAK